MTTHVALDPAFAELIDLWAPVRQIGTGFEFTEGPVCTRGITSCCSRTCRAMCAGAGTGRASQR